MTPNSSQLAHLQNWVSKLYSTKVPGKKGLQDKYQERKIKQKTYTLLSADRNGGSPKENKDNAAPNKNKTIRIG